MRMLGWGLQHGPVLLAWGKLRHGAEVGMDKALTPHILYLAFCCPSEQDDHSHCSEAYQHVAHQCDELSGLCSHHLLFRAPPLLLVLPFQPQHLQARAGPVLACVNNQPQAVPVMKTGSCFANSNKPPGRPDPVPQAGLGMGLPALGNPRVQGMGTQGCYLQGHDAVGTEATARVPGASSLPLLGGEVGSGDPIRDRIAHGTCACFHMPACTCAHSNRHHLCAYVYVCAVPTCARAASLVPFLTHAQA